MKNKKYIIYSIIYTIIDIILGIMCIWQIITGFYALNELFLFIIFLFVLFGDIWSIYSIIKTTKKKF